MSTSSNNSFSHSHSHSHPPRSPSTTPYQTPTLASLQRKSSRTSLRSDSPASLASSRDSLNERDGEGKKEVVHERERNWNSPRPHWSTSKSPSASHVKIRSKDDNSLRASSSLPHLRNSNGHRDTARISAKPQGTIPNAGSSSATSPALLHKPDDHSDLGLEESAVGIIPSAQSKHPNRTSPGKSPGAASKFGWNFARSPLPPLELDDTADRQRVTSSPTWPSGRASEAIMSSHIPMCSRMKSFPSVSHAASDMSFTHVVGEESSFQQDYQNTQNEVTEPHSRGDLATRNSWSQEDVELGMPYPNVRFVMIITVSQVVMKNPPMIFLPSLPRRRVNLQILSKKRLRRIQKQKS